MTALALNYERRMGRPFDHTRSRLHSFSGAARGMLLAVFLHDPEAFIFRPSGKTARNIEELVGLCETHPDEAARHLAAGHFAAWVRMPFHLRCELVVIQREKTDQQTALKRFTAVATGRRKPVPYFFKLGRQDIQWHYFSLDSYLRHLDSVLKDQQWDSQLHWGVDGKLPPGPGRLMSVILDEAREEHLLNWLRELGHTDLARWLARQASALRTRKDRPVANSQARRILDAMIAFDRDPHPPLPRPFRALAAHARRQDPASRLTRTRRNCCGCSEVHFFLRELVFGFTERRFRPARDIQTGKPCVSIALHGHPWAPHLSVV